MAEDNNKKEVKEILEQTHVRYLGDGRVELTHGIDKCVRKVHNFPEYLRTQE